MDIEKAFHTAKEWGRRSGNALCQFAADERVIDDIHLFQLVVEIVVEKAWLLDILEGEETRKYEGTVYSKQDLKNFENLLEVVTTAEPGMKLNGN
jgi:hypothetical protein